MGGQRRANSPEVDILGTSFTATSITKRRLLERFQSANANVHRIRRSLKSWHATYRQRRFIEQTFYFSLVDYVTYLQPATEAIRQASISV